MLPQVPVLEPVPVLELVLVPEPLPVLVLPQVLLLELGQALRWMPQLDVALPQPAQAPLLASPLQEKTLPRPRHRALPINKESAHSQCSKPAKLAYRQLTQMH